MGNDPRGPWRDMRKKELPDGTTLAWQPVTRTRTYEQVLAQIEDQMASGALANGDRLPPERELAQTLNVSRGAVREAVRMLEALGVVQCGTGSGPQSGAIIVDAGMSALGNFLRMHLSLATYSADDLVQVRIQLETWAASLAATNHTDEVIATLTALADQMSAASISEFNDLDASFHVAIAQATGNSLLEILMYGLRDAIRQRMLDAFDTLDNAEEIRDGLVIEHRKIIEAISSGDAPAAAEVVRGHITEFYRHVPAQ